MTVMATMAERIRYAAELILVAEDWGISFALESTGDGIGNLLFCGRALDAPYRKGTFETEITRFKDEVADLLYTAETETHDLIRYLRSW